MSRSTDSPPRWACPEWRGVNGYLSDSRLGDISPTRERGTLETVLFESMVETNGRSWVVSLAGAAG
jgi:hypothetical protein